MPSSSPGLEWQAYSHPKLVQKKQPILMTRANFSWGVHCSHPRACSLVPSSLSQLQTFNQSLLLPCCCPHTTLSRLWAALLPSAWGENTNGRKAKCHKVNKGRDLGFILPVSQGWSVFPGLKIMVSWVDHFGLPQGRIWEREQPELGVPGVKSGNAFPQDLKKKQWHDLVLP